MIYIMSDIHGNKKAFNSIMEQINLQQDDDLYILGDVIDRYPYGIELLQRIMDMPNVHMLLGNHEHMMLDAIGYPYERRGRTRRVSNIDMKYNWFDNGGRSTYANYKRLTKCEKFEIIEYLQNLPLKFDLIVNGKNFRLVHSTCQEIYNEINENSIDRLVCIRLDDMVIFYSNKN